MMAGSAWKENFGQFLFKTEPNLRSLVRQDKTPKIVNRNLVGSFQRNILKRNIATKI